MSKSKKERTKHYEVPSASTSTIKDSGLLKVLQNTEIVPTGAAASSSMSSSFTEADQASNNVVVAQKTQSLHPPPNASRAVQPVQSVTTGHGAATGMGLVVGATKKGIGVCHPMVPSGGDVGDSAAQSIVKNADDKSGSADAIYVEAATEKKTVAVPGPAAAMSTTSQPHKQTSMTTNATSETTTGVDDGEMSRRARSRIRRVRPIKKHAYLQTVAVPASEAAAVAATVGGKAPSSKAAAVPPS